jgi:AcrR family transcriptional regulator
MVELTAEHGYDDVAVGALAKRARVSKRDFYRRFSSKEECFLATYDAIVGRSARGIIAAVEGEEDRSDRLRHGFLAFAGQVATSPETARLALVEVFSAGAVAVERTLSTNRLFEGLLASSLAPAAGAPRLPPLVVKGIVAGCARVARTRLLSGQPHRLLEDGDELLAWALSFCDDDVGRLRGLASAPPLPAAAAGVAPGDERALILVAMARLASEGGYATLTVPQVRAAAGVSRHAFDAHFDGIADCFLATLETISGRTLAAAEPFYLTADDWATGVHLMTARVCRHLAGDPTVTGLAFREFFAPGSEAIRWRSRMIGQLAAMLRRGAPPERRPSELAAEASIGAMWDVIHHFVAIGRGPQLSIAAPLLSYLALAPALGGAAAVEAIRSSAGDGIDR